MKTPAVLLALTLTVLLVDPLTNAAPCDDSKPGYYKKEELSEGSAAACASSSKESTEETRGCNGSTKKSLSEESNSAASSSFKKQKSVEINNNGAGNTEESIKETYTRKSGECDDDYYTRITCRKTDESDSDYVYRLNQIQKCFPSLSLWYDEKYIKSITSYYSVKYAQQKSESEESYVKRLVAREQVDSTDEIYYKRIHLVHACTASNSLWVSEKYYAKYFKAYYQSYYKKGEQEVCYKWLERVLKQLPGECNEDTVKRITLVKGVTADCGCWTEETFKKVESCNVFTSEYIQLIKKYFFQSCSEGEYVKKSESSSSTTAAACAKSSKVTEVSRG